MKFDSKVLIYLSYALIGIFFVILLCQNIKPKFVEGFESELKPKKVDVETLPTEEISAAITEGIYFSEKQEDEQTLMDLASIFIAGISSKYKKDATQNPLKFDYLKQSNKMLEQEVNIMSQGIGISGDSLSAEDISKQKQEMKKLLKKLYGPNKNSRIKSITW